MMQRDTSIDIARGLAILLMIQGNVAAVAYRGEITWGMNACVMAVSFVPAMFITVAGAMVSLSTMRRFRPIGYFLVRMLALLGVAALLIDIAAWRIVPFVGMDVLYLIAVSLPVAFAFGRLPAPARWVGVGIVFLATPMIQATFGYGADVYEIPLRSAGLLREAPLRMIVGQWIVDGWFPLFPWIGFALLGVNLGKIRWAGSIPRSFARTRVVAIGALLVGAGALLWWLYQGPLYTRQGFVEKIYPPTLAYGVTATGEVLLILAALDWKQAALVCHPLRACSESALFIYILHHLIMPFIPVVDTGFGLLLLLIVPCLLLIAAAYFLRFIRRRWQSRPALLRHVLGI